MPKNGFTPEEAQAVITKAWPPETTITDLEEIETYINGPDDPENYFSKFESERELIADFEQFIGKYERADGRMTPDNVAAYRIEPNNVFAYFQATFGVPSNDETLRELTCESPCGAACVRLIEAAKALLPLADSLVHPKIIAAVDEAVQIHWRE